jgi:hypothetical protein
MPADCSDEDVTLAGTLLAPEALAPAVTPIHVTEECFGRVPRVYIECLHDKGYSAFVAATDAREAAMPKGRLLEHRSFAVLFSSSEAHRKFDYARRRPLGLTGRTD